MTYNWTQLELDGRITPENPITQAHVDAVIATDQNASEGVRELWNAHIEGLVRVFGPAVGLAATLRIGGHQLPCTVVKIVSDTFVSETPTIAVQLDAIEPGRFRRDAGGEIYWLYWAPERERYVFRDRTVVLGVRCYYAPGGS